MMDESDLTMEEYIEEKLISKNGYDVLDMTPLLPRDQIHLWLRYQVEGYTKEIIQDFKLRGQAPEKVTATDLFYMRSMDRGTDNVSYLLAKYLFRHTKGRKSRARISEGHFIRIDGIVYDCLRALDD
nr:hypothetical protein [Tanacetum cinerariifolium]